LYRRCFDPAALSRLNFPEQHRTRLHCTKPLERLNEEVKRRADVIGIFPNEASIVRLIGAVLLEQNDERQLQHRSMLGTSRIYACLIGTTAARITPLSAATSLAPR
jgi:transposase-like protein